MLILAHVCRGNVAGGRVSVSVATNDLAVARVSRIDEAVTAVVSGGDSAVAHLDFESF